MYAKRLYNRRIVFKAEPHKEYCIEKIAEITTSEDDFEPIGDIRDITYQELKAEHTLHGQRYGYFQDYN